MDARLLAGVPASPGLAAGAARHLGVLLDGPWQPIKAGGREAELEKARRSLALTASDLERLAVRLAEAGRSEDA
jgi:hypothetical protein